MAEKTGIAWCDHTHNHWIGCEPVSEGCAHCYAERENERFQWVENWSGPRRLTSPANRAKPLAWAKAALKAGVTRRVFCSSLGDILDPKVPEEWRQDLWKLIAECGRVSRGHLEWLLLTKRIEHAEKMLPDLWIKEPPRFVRLGVTTENQRNADWRIPKLFEVWSGKNFISVEPMLGPVDIAEFCGSPVLGKCDDLEPDSTGWVDLPVYAHGIDWVICGAESGPLARPMSEGWVRCLRNQCVTNQVPFMLKQMVVGGQLVKLPSFEGWVWAQFPEDV